MRSRHSRGFKLRRLVAAFLVVALLTVLLPQGVARADTPTIGGGDCWQWFTPHTCTWNYQGANTPATFKVIDHFSWARWVWIFGVGEAINRWNGPAGPQSLSQDDQPNNVWVFMEFADNGGPGEIARTQLCNTGWWCTSMNVPIEIYFSSVFMFANTIDCCVAPADFDSAMTHELGHAMGLFHNDTEVSVMAPQVSSANMSPWPTLSDTGTHIPSPCFAGTPPMPGGLRCVYNYGL